MWISIYVLAKKIMCEFWWDIYFKGKSLKGSVFRFVFTHFLVILVAIKWMNLVEVWNPVAAFLGFDIHKQTATVHLTCLSCVFYCVNQISLGVKIQGKKLVVIVDRGWKDRLSNGWSCQNFLLLNQDIVNSNLMKRICIFPTG